MCQFQEQYGACGCFAQLTIVFPLDPSLCPRAVERARATNTEVRYCDPPATMPKITSFTICKDSELCRIKAFTDRKWQCCSCRGFVERLDKPHCKRCFHTPCATCLLFRSEV